MVMNSLQIPSNTIFIHCHPGTTETLDKLNSYNVVQTANGAVFEARLDSTISRTSTAHMYTVL